MLNRPQHQFDSSSSRSADASWDVDERPELRLSWLFVLMVLPLIVIGGRLVWVQGLLTDTYLEAFDVEAVAYEPIPKRDGRILSADGRVLADDLQQFDVLVQYRWVETPANARWLKQQAQSRLGREDRRHRERVEDEQRNVLELRESMWARLAELAEIDAAQLRAKRDAVQQRVERIAQSVDWNRREREWAESRETESATSDSRPWWERAWRTAVSELTTAPHRALNEPVIIQEELQHHLLLENVPLRVAAEIQAHPERYPGLRIETSAIRIYPQRSLAPHIVGARTPITDEDLAARKERFSDQDPWDYRAGDRIGKSGIEKSYDRELRGVRGLKKIVTNRRGDVVRTETVREARPGSDVVLTLDLNLQQRLESLLDKTLQSAATDESGSATEARTAMGGCILAMDVHTGAILAAASAPRFDLDLFVHPDTARWKELSEDPRRPFFDRAMQMALPPGSVFKALTAIAFLESGRVDPDERIVCAGYLDSPNRYRCFVYTHYGVGHGETDLSDALAQSCNVYFFANARKTGPDPIVLWAERFGFGQRTGVDLPGEAAGRLPKPPPAPVSSGTGRSNAAAKWQPADTLGLAIGQSKLLVTPIQVARLMAAVANGGQLVTPHVVRPQRPAPEAASDMDDLKTPRWSEPQPIHALQSGTLERVREGLERVVADRRGTAYKTVRRTDVTIAGKTGTAEVGGGKPDHAWFAGYAPADRPRIAFVVVLEHGGSGGRAAGPVARETVQALLDVGLLHAGQITRSQSP